MLPTHRPPTHPGEMLLKEFLEPLGVSQVEAADRHHASGKIGKQIVNGFPALGVRARGHVSARLVKHDRERPGFRGRLLALGDPLERGVADAVERAGLAGRGTRAWRGDERVAC